MNRPIDSLPPSEPGPQHGQEVLRITLPCDMKAVADIGRLACRIWGKNCTFTSGPGFMAIHKPVDSSD